MNVSSDNMVTVSGNAVRDPELRFLPSGQAVANFGIAVNRRWLKDGEWQEEASFFDVSCFGILSENVAQSITRGARITVTGRLAQRTWQTQDGEKRSKVEITADDVAISLKWATVDTITKTEKRAPAGVGSNSQAVANEPSGGGGGVYDEEPFMNVLTADSMTDVCRHRFDM